MMKSIPTKKSPYKLKKEKLFCRNTNPKNYVPFILLYEIYIIQFTPPKFISKDMLFLAQENKNKQIWFEINLGKIMSNGV